MGYNSPTEEILDELFEELAIGEWPDTLSSDPVQREAEFMLTRMHEQGNLDATLESCIETLEAYHGCSTEEELETGLRHKEHFKEEWF